MSYERPIVLSNTEVAEGVFAASGAPSAATPGGLTAILTNADKWGNYYFDVPGYEPGATYNVTISVAETEKVNGLSSATFVGQSCTVSGTTATCTIRLWDQHPYSRLYFSTMGNWERGWELEDKDLPAVSVSLVKVG